MSVTIQTQIADAILQHTPSGAEGLVNCYCNNERYDSFAHHAEHVAAAVQDALEVWLPPLFASAIHAYADSELTGLPGYGDDPTAVEALEKFNKDAASITTYALTSSKWRPV